LEICFVKKIVIGIVVFGFASAALAGSDYFAKPVNYFDGFYAGIGGGVAFTGADAKANGSGLLQHDETYTDSNAPINNWSSSGKSNLPLALDSKLNQAMGAGEIFVGFGKSLAIGNVGRNNFYVGFEVFGKLTPTDMDTDYNGLRTDSINVLPPINQTDVLNSGTLKAQLENYYSFGGDLRFGYLITPRIMVYVLAGIDIAPFKYTVDYNGTISNDSYYNPITEKTLPINLASGVADGNTSWMSGFMPGVGVEAMITNHLSLRAQFVYTYWGEGDFGINDAHTSGYSYTATPKDGKTATLRDTFTSSVAGDASSIQRGLLTVDLTYHFN
jgi:opacity protein-like surface antigen